MTALRSARAAAASWEVPNLFLLLLIYSFIGIFLMICSSWWRLQMETVQSDFVLFDPKPMDFQALKTYLLKTHARAAGRHRRGRSLAWRPGRGSAAASNETAARRRGGERGAARLRAERERGDRFFFACK